MARRAREMIDMLIGFFMGVLVMLAVNAYVRDARG